MYAYKQEATSGTSSRPVLQQIFKAMSYSRQKDFSSSIVEPLVSSSYGFELVKTLDQFLADNLNVSQAAKHLYLHRNTLVYRLTKIRSLTGLDPRNFDEAMELRLALLLWQYNNREQAATAVLRRVSNGV